MYNVRGERYAYMETGHAGQNVYLQATALDLGTVAIGAFHDEEVRKVLQLDDNTRPMYIMPVGKPS
jgi:SagB-type dehydrogenase family enzyme